MTAVVDRWDRRVARARTLAIGNVPESALLTTYARLLEIQRDCYKSLCAAGVQLSGSLERDLPLVRPYLASMVSGLRVVGPPVADESVRLLDRGEPALEEMLTSAWRVAFGQSFLARLFLQPYAERLAALGVRPVDRPSGAAGRTCPFCGGVPQLAILQSAAPEDGASRHLLCATCTTVWRSGRFVCANCGEQDERHLPYFHTTELAHVRIDACDACRHYLKTIDLTRLGNAEPLVDEVAAGALDVWAVEHGFTKIELNLVGL